MSKPVLSSNLSFGQIAELHHEHEQLFYLHQKALIDRQVNVAFELLQKYEHLLNEHILLEEKMLFPVYAAHEKEGGEVILFTGEHKRIKEFVQRFYEWLYAIKQASADEQDKLMLKLLDHQALFKGLIEHHHRREEIYLFPTLDEVLKGYQKNKVLACFL